jgi:hypothetical protein
MYLKRSLISAVVAACIAVLMLPTIALSIPRDVVLARGKVWVNYARTVSGKTELGVPYSQSKWAYESGVPVTGTVSAASSKGYRTDCSGFASLCYNLRDSSGHPLSLSTADFGAKGSKQFFEIAKSQLIPGDMVLASAVWGAPGPHAIIFAGWVDSAQTQFWAMEQTSSSSHDGTILHPRSWQAAVDRKFKPYRYAGLDDPFADVEEGVSYADASVSAAAAADAAFPTTSTTSVPAVVIASESQWGDQVTAASLSGAVRGPMLVTKTKYLPSVTFDELKRLKPKRAFVLGSTNAINAAVVKKIESLGIGVVRINGADRYSVAAAALRFTKAEAAASHRPVDTVYVAGGTGTAYGLAAAPLLTRTARPLVFVGSGAKAPGVVVRELGRAKIKHLVILGGTKSVSTAMEKQLRKLGYKVDRVGGADCYKSSAAIAKYAIGLKVGFSWAHLGVAAPVSCSDALSWGASNGFRAQLVVLTAPTKMDSTVRWHVARFHSEIGKARIYGGAASVSQPVRKVIATTLRSGK